MVQKTVGGYSNVITLEVTIIASSFDPATLAGAKIVADFSDITTLFQDDAGTTPITASGQFVTRINNRGPLGGFFQNAGAVQRPLYEELGGRKYMKTDGGDDDNLLLDTGGPTFGLENGFFLWLLAYDDGAAHDTPARAFMAITSPGVNAPNNPSGLTLYGTDFSGDTIACSLTAGLNSNGIDPAISDARTTNLPWSIIEIEASLAINNPNAWLRVEQAADGGTPGYEVSVNTTGWPDSATGATRMVLGAGLNGGGGAVNGHHRCQIAAAVLVSGALSTTDRDKVRQWLRDRAVF
jgi:hypothetical protein